MTVVSLSDARFDRDIRIVSLAQAVRETIYGCAEDPTPMAVSLHALLADFDSDMAWSDHIIAHRVALAAAAAPPGADIGPIELTDPIDRELHETVVKRDREYLQRISASIGVPLLKGRT